MIVAIRVSDRFVKNTALAFFQGIVLEAAPEHAERRGLAHVRKGIYHQNGDRGRLDTAGRGAGAAADEHEDHREQLAAV